VSAIKFNPPKGSPPSIEWAPVVELRVDEAYQRAIDTPPSQKLILEIAQNWDWGLCGPLNVSRRDGGTLYVLDGQHRLAAAKMRGDIPHLPALIVGFRTQQAEASFFVAANTARKNPTPLDRFNARCLAGDEEAIAIRKIIERAGLRVGRNHYTIKAGEITCVAIMTRLYRQYGEKLFSAAVVNMAEAWPGEGMKSANEMLPGICLLLYQVPDDFDPDLFVEVLSSREQMHWFMNAASERDGDDEWPDEVFRNLLLEAYLKRREQLAAVKA